MLRGILSAIVLLAIAAAPAAAGIDARLMRYPDVSATQIAFVYAGDIWVAPKEGGPAARLSTPAGEESFPRFSPDGEWIAFSGNYDGNQDIYVIPAEGGVPRRLTHHPMPDRMLDWYPDGKSILFSTLATSGKLRFRQIYKVSKDGGLAEKLPMPYGEFGTIAPDGKTLAYLPLSVDFRTWKRYRGGMTTDIWLFDLDKKTAKNMTDHHSINSQPMWHGSTVYFHSDRDEAKRANIWAYDTKSAKLRQITKFTDYDLRFPSIGPAELVFEQGGKLWLMDLESERYREIEIDAITDLATLKPRAEQVKDLVQWAAISPSGKRALFQARGDVFSVPAEHGPVLNLSRTSGVAERYPVWSPDGKEIAYFSDRTGEYELTVRPADGSGEEKTLTKMGKGFRYQPFWSPDGKKLAFIDQAMKIWIYDRGADKLTQIDQALYMFHGGLQGFTPAWSPDSRWLAYDRDFEHRQRGIFLYDTRKNDKHQVTSAFYDDSSPVFDPDGKYLYLLTGRDWNPVYSDIDDTWVYNNSTVIAAVPLRKDVPSPLAQRNDEEKAEDKDDKKDDDKKGDKKDEGDKKDDDKKKGEDKEDDDKKEEPKPVEIDLDGFERRLVVLPAKPGNYDGLSAVAGKVIFRRQPRTGSGEEKRPVVFYDLEKREEKTIVGDANWFAVSNDGKKMLVGLQGDNASIVDIAADQKTEKMLALGDMEMTVDPKAEWRQIFRDAWRLERDYFYDPNLHGVNWDEMYSRYGKLLDEAVTRWDVDFLLGELIGELNASHAYKGGGDMEQEASRGVGVLGADFELHDGAYRIARILDGAVWDSEVRAPLAEPGVNVKVGDYLLAVNGDPLDTTKDPWAALQGLADKTIALTVNDKPSMDGARQVLVKTLASEARLRNLAWIEGNRQRVEELSGGRVGYIYVPSTGINGQTELLRMFRGQFTKEALIIDERFNDGGQIPTRFIEALNRPITNYWGVRDGKDWQWPPVAHVGPKAMLVNEWSGSGGDCFPYYFRQAGLGPLIGQTTWGGLIGISGAPGLIDGGTVTVPTFGFYDTEGKWAVENEGVAPDIAVIDDPARMAAGGDPQLERAVEEMLKALATSPPAHPPKPAYPVRSGR